MLALSTDQDKNIKMVNNLLVEIFTNLPLSILMLRLRKPRIYGISILLLIEPHASSFVSFKGFLLGGPK